MKWNKTKDILPDDEQVVLIITHGGTLWIARWADPYYKTKLFVEIFEEYQTFGRSEIDYWYPLPEPPEGMKYDHDDFCSSYERIKGVRYGG